MREKDRERQRDKENERELVRVRGERDGETGGRAHVHKEGSRRESEGHGGGRGGYLNVCAQAVIKTGFEQYKLLHLFDDLARQRGGGSERMCVREGDSPSQVMVLAMM